MFEEQYEYDCMGNVTSLKRNGLQDGGTYGLIDDLTLSYDGNRQRTGDRSLYQQVLPHNPM